MYDVSHSGLEGGGGNTLMIKLWSMRIWHCASRRGTSSAPRDMKVVFEEELPGLLKKNMSNRYYDIFMFEMTFHVCYGNSRSIGIFAGGKLWKS